MCGNTTSKNRASASSVTSTRPGYYARINLAWTLSGRLAPGKGTRSICCVVIILLGDKCRPTHPARQRSATASRRLVGIAVPNRWRGYLTIVMRLGPHVIALRYRTRIVRKYNAA
jgi:hypothetical protein